MIKCLYNKLKCYLGLHVWVLEKNINAFSDRRCIYCGKQQHKVLLPSEKISQPGSVKWVSYTNIRYKTDIQKTYLLAKTLLQKAATLSNELSKFDPCLKQKKTKTFMHLVNAAKTLSKDYMDLKEKIRELHIQKQKD